MRRNSIIFLAIIFLTYSYQGYKVYHKYIHDEVKIKISGLLSDITDNVISIPLETPDSVAIQRIKRVQRDGNDIFLLGDRRLLHFNASGKFINEPAADISNMEGAFIADYAIDTDRHQITVIDSLRNYSKYDYSGNLISRAKITQPWNKLTAFTYHNGSLWAAAELLLKNTDDDSYTITHNLYQLDMNMNEISCMNLRHADVGHEKIFTNIHPDEILVDEEGVYAYSTPIDMENLLNDTLYILQNRIIPTTNRNVYNSSAYIYPVRKSKRYMISTYYSTDGDCHTFCFDNSDYTAYILQEGFKDDIFNTGNIADLQPLDNYNKSYCYTNTKADISAGSTENETVTVLYIATLKS